MRSNNSIRSHRPETEPEFSFGDKIVCITLDLENDWEFDDPQYDHLTLKYLDDFIELIAGLDVPLTVFVVGQTLERYPEAVDRLDEHLNCEFHLHSYQHDTSKSYDFRTEIQRGVEVFRDHFGEPPKGYRAPQETSSRQNCRYQRKKGLSSTPASSHRIDPAFTTIFARRYAHTFPRRRRNCSKYPSHRLRERASRSYTAISNCLDDHTCIT